MGRRGGVHHCQARRQGGSCNDDHDHDGHEYSMILIMITLFQDDVLQAKAARVSLRADELLKQLVQPEERMKKEVGNDVVVVALQVFLRSKC